MTLAEIYDRYQQDEEFEELRKQANFVPGDGPPKAKVVFVGEAPGRTEDKELRPFVGAAGKILSECLESIGLKRQDVFITNIVKYRPPNNRDPLPAEVEAGVLYLLDEIVEIQPDIVVLLGRHALSAFLPGELKAIYPISRVHGKFITTSDAHPRLMAMYHPATALYSKEKMLPVLQADFQTLGEHLARVQV